MGSFLRRVQGNFGKSPIFTGVLEFSKWVRLVIFLGAGWCILAPRAPKLEAQARNVGSAGPVVVSELIGGTASGRCWRNTEGSPTCLLGGLHDLARPGTTGRGLARFGLNSIQYGSGGVFSFHCPFLPALSFFSPWGIQSQTAGFVQYISAPAFAEGRILTLPPNAAISERRSPDRHVDKGFPVNLPVRRPALRGQCQDVEIDGDRRDACPTVCPAFCRTIHPCRTRIRSSRSSGSGSNRHRFYGRRIRRRRCGRRIRRWRSRQCGFAWTRWRP